MRGQGRVYRPTIGGRESQVWWLDYSVRGTRHRESSKMTSKRDALELLRQKIGDRKTGKVTGNPAKLTLADLKAMLKTHYTIAGSSSWWRAEYAFKHIEKYDALSADVRAVDVDDETVAAYQEWRLNDGAARNSVRYETACLNTAFSIAEKRLGRRIKFRNVALDAASIRQGFFDEGELAALVLHLPAAIGDLIRFLYMVGWRRGEGIGLMWAAIDWDDADYPGEHEEPVPGENACIRIDGTQTKGGEDREYPIYDAPELRELLLARWRARDGLHVFHRHGKAIGDFRKVWERATKAAGVEGRLVHDLRRSAARDARRNGVSEGEIMKLQGWRTRAMFDRYAIIDQTDLRRAVARRFGANGKQQANNPVASEAGR